MNHARSQPVPEGRAGPRPGASRAKASARPLAPSHPVQYPEGEARNVGDQQDAEAEDGHERQDVPVERWQRLSEASGREEEIEPDGREQEPQLEVREEDDAEVDRVEMVGGG